MGSRRTAFGGKHATHSRIRQVDNSDKQDSTQPATQTGDTPHIQTHNNMAHNGITHGDATCGNPSHSDSTTPNNAPVQTPMSDTAVTDKLSTKAENSSPRLAVITVTYSPGKYLTEFLDSIPTATTLPTQVYLADNGSTDGAPEQAARNNDTVEFLPTGGNVGYGTAINIAARHIIPRIESGEIHPEFFVIANPDVVFDPGSIDELIKCAHRWPNAADVGPYIRQEDGSAYPSARAIPTLSNGIGHALLSGIWPNNPWSKAYRDNAVMDEERVAGWLSGSCLLVRWDAFCRIGGFDERYFMYMEDVDLGDRFGRAGFTNVLCPTAQITHAVGHSAGKHPESMLPAHHESAYRFQADRHPHWWQAPIRAMLWIGLKIRSVVVVGFTKMKK